MSDIFYPSVQSALFPARSQSSGSTGKRLGFLLARSLRDEGRLSLWSDSATELADAAQGLRIAVVGNARALSQSSFGADIDAHDIVCRINTAPMPRVGSHGLRTDWLASSIPVTRRRMDDLSPRRVLWMTRKRKRLPYCLARRNGFYLNPKPAVETLAARLGASPSTGVMVLDLVRHLPFQQVSLYGFDFFASLSNSGSRSAHQVPHDFKAERDYATALLTEDTRFTLH